MALALVTGSSQAVRTQGPAPPAPTPNAPPGTAQEYVIELKHLRAKYQSDGSGERQLKVRVKVLTESAVREWGRLPFPYAPDTEQLQIDRVQVRKADGTVTANATGDVQDLAVRPPGDPAALVDLRQKQIAVTALRPGDTLELEATWKVTRPVTPGHFWFEYLVNRLRRRSRRTPRGRRTSDVHSHCQKPSRSGTPASRRAARRGRTPVVSMGRNEHHRPVPW